LPLEEAFNRGELIEPKAFRARILVWSTCFGAIDNGAPLDRQWTVVHQFNTNAGVDVVLAKWRGAFGHGPFNELIENLAIGTPVGAAVAAFNATGGMRERGAQFAIFGDPRVSAPFRNIHPGMEAFYTAHMPPESSFSTIASEPRAKLPACEPLSMLQDCIRVPLRFNDEESDAAAARAQFEDARAALQDDRTNSQSLNELQRAALQCFQRYADVVRGWSPRVTGQKFALGATCAHCGELKSDSINAFKAPLRSRRLSTCPRCQVAADTPVEYDLDFRVAQDRRLELVGSIPDGRFSGLAVLWSTTPMAGTARPWPVADDGRPLRHFALDVPWPRAPARVTVWMMFDLDFLTLNHRVQGVTSSAAHS
jgi:hypothetical protein